MGHLRPNGHNDAYPLARPSEAAAIATLRHEAKIVARLSELRTWTEALAGQMRALGICGQKGFEHLLLGSVSDGVVRHSRIPVRLVP